MNKLLKNTIWFIFILLGFINIFVFIKGIKISTEIGFYEKEIKKLHQDNIDLEKQAFSFDSLQYAASMAASMDFAKNSQPIFIENVKLVSNL